ncbi:MAG: hypothetical protein ABI790_12100, partial [Betaproteobacteria bacterium]
RTVLCLPNPSALQGARWNRGHKERLREFLCVLYASVVKALDVWLQNPITGAACRPEMAGKARQCSIYVFRR